LVPFLHPCKDHSHYRLYNLGMGQRKTVLLVYLLGTTGGLLFLVGIVVELGVASTLLTSRSKPC
jgi:hypothetical protein